jgi:VacB/RNase II family 3'-5' exoribonuclease
MSAARTPFDLQAAALACMRAHGFDPEFPSAATAQAAQMAEPSSQTAPAVGVRDLRQLLWSSIDNDTSRDLDQIEVAERMPDGGTKVRVGIADVDAYVPKHSPIDDHAAAATTTVYTGVRMFPMLPERLSTGLTSLLEGQDRLSVVIEFVVDAQGRVGASDVYRALVQNHAQLAYDAIGRWLEGTGPAPAKVTDSRDLQEQLRLQDACADALRTERFRHGALNIETIETYPILSHDQVTDVVRQQKSRATDLIEDFMIASNEVVARLLQTARVSSLRRVVKAPERWDRIVDLAQTLGASLPQQPDSRALNDFLMARKAAAPDHFPDLSLAVIKLLGPGEYVLERPGDPETGHFGLAVQDYTHSTAPNRRFADLVTQRLVHAVLEKAPAPYSDDELSTVARDCTQKGDAARKVEREMSKRIAAVAMSDRIGQTFDAVVTGVTPNGTFVRVQHPHVEGLLARGQQGLDVGDKLRVTLVRVDVDRGYIDFGRTPS